MGKRFSTICTFLVLIVLMGWMFYANVLYVQAAPSIIEVREIVEEEVEEQVNESETEYSYPKFQYIPDDEVPMAERIDGRSGGLILLLTVSYFVYALVRIKRNQLVICNSNRNNVTASFELIKKGRISLMITAVFLILLVVLCFFWASRADLVLTIVALALAIISALVLSVQNNKISNLL